MTPGLVDLPSVGQAQRAPDHVVEVVVDAGGQLRLRLDSKGDGDRINLRQLPQKVLALQGSAGANPANVPVVISADKGVQYETVVKVMDSLQRAGVVRVGLAVRTTGDAAAAN
jgi:biopolymer transport protein TolR